MPLKQFIKLGTTMAINSNMIRCITVNPTSCSIQVYNLHGGGSYGYTLAGTGFLCANPNFETITICKEKAPMEYDYFAQLVANM